MRRRGVRCLLSIGSNQGDRARNIAHAIRRLSRLPRTRLLRTSRLYRSSPVGSRGQRDFLNGCAEIRTGLRPIGLLIELKRLEAELGRRPARRWSARPLDVDILFYGQRRIGGDLLRIPHPRALKRRFVLAPLAELHPPARRWLARLKAPSQNVKLFEK